MEKKAREATTDMPGTFLETYAYQIIVLFTPLPFLLFALLLYARDMGRRPRFALRFFGYILFTLCLFVGLAILRTRVETIYTRLFSYIFKYLFLLPMVFFCYEDAFANKMLTWCATVATAEIDGRIFLLLVTLAKNKHYETLSLFPDHNVVRDWAIYIAFRLVVTFLIFLLFRKAKCLEADRESVRQITGLSMFFAVWLILFQGFSREYMRESDKLYMVINVSGIVFGFAVLALRAGVLTQNRYRQEIATTERLLAEERKQYDSFKENIEIVNMRCHDLKHQLEDVSHKLTEDEVVRIREALQIYDSSLKTGNEVLDVVLYEKQLVFANEGIRFTCLADGKLLGFMRTTHVYALFHNALGNALEATRKLTDPEKKVIDLCVQRAGDEAEITVMNGFDGRLPQEGTRKSDPNRHGLGLKSMRYVAEQYGGALWTEADGEVFTLLCKIPLPGPTSAAVREEA